MLNPAQSINQSIDGEKQQWESNYTLLTTRLNAIFLFCDFCWLLLCIWFSHSLSSVIGWIDRVIAAQVVDE